MGSADYHLGRANGDEMSENEGRIPQESEKGEEGTDSGTGQTLDPEEQEQGHDSGEGKVDRDSKDSFPASDPPAW